MILPLAMLLVDEATDGQVHEEVAGDSEVPMDTLAGSGSSSQEGAGAEATADDGRTDRTVTDAVVKIEDGLNKYLSKDFMDPYVDANIKIAFELTVFMQN